MGVCIVKLMLEFMHLRVLTVRIHGCVFVDVLGKGDSCSAAAEMMNEFMKMSRVVPGHAVM